MYIGEAPNRISPVDFHFTKQPELAQQRIETSAYEGWKKRVQSEETLELGLYRNGQHVGFEEFELSLNTSLESNTHFSQHFIADNWSEPMMNLYPLRWFEPRNLEDFETLAQIGIAKNIIHPACDPYGTRLLSDTKDNLGVPIIQTKDQQQITYHLPPHTHRFTLGITKDSQGSVTLRLNGATHTNWSINEIRAGNHDMWTLQSWKEIDLPPSDQWQEMQVIAETPSTLGLCPVFVRVTPPHFAVL